MTAETWDTREVRLWIANDEGPYWTALDCRTPAEMRETFEGMTGPRVDWNAVDWEWVFDMFEEDREGR